MCFELLFLLFDPKQTQGRILPEVSAGLDISKLKRRTTEENQFCSTDSICDTRSGTPRFSHPAAIQERLVVSLDVDGDSYIWVMFIVLSIVRSGFEQVNEVSGHRTVT
jgi:hypothetical protein